MKFLRRIGSLLVLFVLIAVVAMACLYYFIDPDKLKPAIIAEVKQQTGYQIVLDGHLQWTFYPVLGVKIEHVTLSEAGQVHPFLDLRYVTFATKMAELLHGVSKFQGDVYSSDVRFLNVHARAMRVSVHWNDNVLTLRPISALLYEGSLQGAMQGRGFGSVPRWNWNVQANGIQLKEFLEDVNGPQSKIKISGLGNFKLRAVTSGKTKNELLKNMNGVCEFTFDKGALEGIDLNYLVQSADAFIHRQAFNVPSSNVTAFDKANGSAVILDGIATTHNLLLASPVFTVKADGMYDLSQQNLDFQLQVTPILGSKAQWMVPVLVRGNVYSPVIRLDTVMLETNIAKEQLEKVKSKVQEQINTLPDKANKFIKKILG